MSKSSFICVILCGVLVACLPHLVAPSDSYISDSLNPVATDNEFDLFPPFQPVYFNSIYSPFQFSVSVPLDYSDYDFVWSYSSGGLPFINTSEPYSIFYSFDNRILLKSSGLLSVSLDCDFYIKCDVFETGTSNLLHTYYFSYQFFDISSLQNNSSKSAVKSIVDSQEEAQEEQLQEEQLQEEQPQEEQLQEEQPQEEQLQEEQLQEEQPQEEIEGGEDGE